jgi:alkylhydroperoxidase family enzyme
MRLPAPPPPWYLRPLHWWQRRKYGVLLDPTALWSYRPRALLAFLGLVRALRGRRSPLPAELRALVALRVSQLNRRAFCVDMNASMLDDFNIAQDKASAVADWCQRPEFVPTERLALEYAEAMTSTPPAVSDDLFQRLRAILPPAAIVELTAVVALQNMSARFNSALQADAYGFCRLPGRSTSNPGADVSNFDGAR